MSIQKSTDLAMRDLPDQSSTPDPSHDYEETRQSSHVDDGNIYTDLNTGGADYTNKHVLKKVYRWITASTGVSVMSLVISLVVLVMYLTGGQMKESHNMGLDGLRHGGQTQHFTGESKLVLYFETLKLQYKCVFRNCF